MFSRRRFLAVSAAGFAASLTGVARQASAQAIGKTATIVVGFAAGGSADIVARLIAEPMKGSYAPSVIVDNRPGAGGRIGVGYVKNAEADGSTMLLTPAGMMVIYPHVYKRLAYDPLKDFTPVTSVCWFPFAFSVGPAVPASVKTVADFVKWAKANPSQASYGSAGAGTVPHFLGVMLGQAAGFEFNHVPYKGGAPAIQDVVGGQIPASFNVLAEALPHAKAGKLRVLATTGATRSKFLPEAPTLKEAGYPDLEALEWFGVFVPAKTPPETVKKLAAAIGEAVKAPNVQERFAQLAFEAAPTTPTQFAAMVKTAYQRWGPIVKASGFSAED